MKTVWRSKADKGFRFSTPPDADKANWDEVEVGTLGDAERVALRIDQMNDESVSRYTKLEREIDTLKAQVLARGTTVSSEPEKVKPISLCKLFRGIATNRWNGAEYERDVVNSPEARALGGTVDTAGGYAVPPEYLGSEFIPLLRSQSVLDKAGTRFLTNITGSPILIPKQTGGATAYWIGENATITESAQTFGQINLHPRQCAAFTIVSNQLLMQANPSAEQMVRDDLTRVLALKIDLAGLKGTGTDGQPTGIYYTTGINTSSATGAIVNTIWAMIGENEIDNVLMEGPGASAVLSPTGWYKLRQNAAAAGYPKNYTGAGYTVDDAACGIKVLRSSQLSAADCIVGNFNDLIVANWAGIVFAASESAGNAFQYNQTYMRAIALVDVGVRNAVSFCLNTVFGT